MNSQMSILFFSWTQSGLPYNILKQLRPAKSLDFECLAQINSRSPLNAGPAVHRPLRR